MALNCFQSLAGPYTTIVETLYRYCLECFGVYLKVDFGTFNFMPEGKACHCLFVVVPK